MKKIIEGKMYSTKTAIEICEQSASCPTNDFNYFEEILYRTKKGSWFLAGNGHGNSKYSKRIDNHTRGAGEGLIPLTEEEARDYLERYNETDLLEQYFKIEEA